MKVLVTGASGFIGSTLVDQLSKDPHITEVRALLRSTSSRENLAGLSYKEAMGSLSDRKSLEKAMSGVDVVYHLAGVTAALNVEGYMIPNAQGTEVLGQVAKECQVKRVVYVSSLAAGGPGRPNHPRQELEDPSPVSLYGKSKLEGEKRLVASGAPCMIIRPPMVYGPKDKDVLVIIKTVASRLAPRIEGPRGQKFYSIIHSEDLCRAIRHLSKIENLKSGEVFYVGENVQYTYQQIIQSMSEALGVKPLSFVLPQSAMKILANSMGVLSRLTGKVYPLNPDKFYEIAVDYWTCDPTKANATGWSAEISLATGMKETVRWYRQRNWL